MKNFKFAVSVSFVLVLEITVRAQKDGSALWKDCDPNGQRACCISNCKCLYGDDKTINKIEVKLKEKSFFSVNIFIRFSVPIKNCASSSNQINLNISENMICPETTSEIFRGILSRGCFL